MLARVELVHAAGMPYLLIRNNDGSKHFELDPMK